MSYTEHVTAVRRKSQQQLHFLRKLRAFTLDPTFLLCIYCSTIEPLITYCSIIIIECIASCYRHLTNMQVESSHNLIFLALVRRLFSMYDIREYLEKDASSNPRNLTAQMN